MGLDPALALMVLLSVTPATTVFEFVSLMNAEVKMVLTYMTLARLINNSAYDDNHDFCKNNNN